MTVGGLAFGGDQIKEILPTLYPNHLVDKEKTSDNRKLFLEHLHELASEELTAEGTGASKMLTTKSLESISFLESFIMLVAIGEAIAFHLPVDI